jgi:putative phage-type endonuclease
MAAAAELTEDEKWHAWRSKGVGASDVGALLGLSKWSSPLSLWMEKLGLLPPSEETQRQRIGKRMETVLAAEFQDETGLTLAGKQTWLTSLDWSIARCTIDAAVVPGPDERPRYDGTIHQIVTPDLVAYLGPWEAKTSGMRKWDEIPPTYLAQIQWQMYVMGAERAWLTVMFSGWNIETYEVDRDQADIDFMVDRAKEFWHLVETETMPEVDGLDATTEALAHLYPRHIEGRTADLSALADQVSRLLELKDEAKRIKDETKELNNEVRAAIGDAEIAEINGYPAFTFRQQPGQKRTCSACSHIDQGEPFRVLRQIKRKGATS